MLTHVLADRCHQLTSRRIRILVSVHSRLLGYVDKIGTMYESHVIGTGYGAYIALPLLRKGVFVICVVSALQSGQLVRITIVYECTHLDGMMHVLYWVRWRQHLASCFKSSWPFSCTL